MIKIKRKSKNEYSGYAVKFSIWSRREQRCLRPSEYDLNIENHTETIHLACNIPNSEPIIVVEEQNCVRKEHKKLLTNKNYKFFSWLMPFLLLLFYQISIVLREGEYIIVNDCSYSQHVAFCFIPLIAAICFSLFLMLLSWGLDLLILILRILEFIYNIIKGD